MHGARGGPVPSTHTPWTGTEPGGARARQDLDRDSSFCSFRTWEGSPSHLRSPRLRSRQALDSQCNVQSSASVRPRPPLPLPRAARRLLLPKEGRRMHCIRHLSPASEAKEDRSRTGPRLGKLPAFASASGTARTSTVRCSNSPARGFEFQAEAEEKWLRFGKHVGKHLKGRRSQAKTDRKLRPGPLYSLDIGRACDPLPGSPVMLVSLSPDQQTLYALSRICLTVCCVDTG